MDDSDKDFKQNLKKLRPKKKMTVPKEFLENANSYDDKVILVKTISEREKNRVLLIIKGMLKDAVQSSKRK